MEKRGIIDLYSNINNIEMPEKMEFKNNEKEDFSMDLCASILYSILEELKKINKMLGGK